jgi:hypothetical protein
MPEPSCGRLGYGLTCDTPSLSPWIRKLRTAVYSEFAFDGVDGKLGKQKIEIYCKVIFQHSQIKPHTIN